jgi:glycosyltransferase involved in cell wall biosynthesis
MSQLPRIGQQDLISSPTAPLRTQRVRANGKHLELDGHPFSVRGVTYGSFPYRNDGAPFPDPVQIKQDLFDIAQAGFNTVRTYDLPPSELLDIAAESGLKTIVGLHYEDWRQLSEGSPRRRQAVLEAGRRAVAGALERCAGRSEVLAISVGNEVPADLVRLHGSGHVEHVLSSLIDEIHRADPEMLTTYNNFPTTEYLRIEGQDVACFNVFLEDPERLRRYLRRLQIITPGLPLVISELGLASQSHGEATQAQSLAAQLETVDETGCAGATIFAWTDEWAVGGETVSGWGFGLTDEGRRPKPALALATDWAARSISDLRLTWPTMTVVVCAYNEARVIGDCLSSLQACDYPGLEVLVCDDGSTDETAAIAGTFPFRVRQLSHGGLSRARNAGIDAASGEIVTFLDADAMCHPHWPYHLALSLEEPGVVGTGGPNLPFENVGLVERAVAECPGNPVEVLIGDDRAEHVPGCNMAFERSALAAVGGFDPLFTSAGDDVDLCWKLLDRGEEIGFSAAAQVRHHRRGTVKGFLRQQRGYGRAERLVAARHRHRFNRLGQARWRGAVYGGIRAVPRILRPVVYHGPLGIAPFQGVVYEPSEHVMSWSAALIPLSLPLALAGLAVGVFWWPGLVLSAVAAALVAVFAMAAAIGARPRSDEPQPAAFRTLVGAIHVAQPFARTWGRIRATPPRLAPVRRRTWDGDRMRWLETLSEQLVSRRCSVRFGGPHDSWDVQAAFGPFVRARITTAVVWGWVPTYNTRLRPRPITWVLLATGTGLVAASGSWVGWVMIGLTAIGAVLEAVLLRRRASNAVAITTEGASG